LGSLLCIVSADPSGRCHPLRHQPVSFRHILILGTKKSAGVSRHRLYLARPLNPQPFVSLQPPWDVLPFGAFQQHGKREAIFDRLRCTLAEMRHHRVGGVTKQRHPTG
jgi:hypothetical protein